jgi:hypothetical protein
MKKNPVIIFLLLIAFVSCEKEKSFKAPDTNYHLSFTVDGVNKIYTGHVLAHTDTAAGYTTLTILGTNTPTSVDDYLGIYLDNFPDKGIIKAGVYEDNSPSFTLLTTYANSAKEYEAGLSVAEDAVTDNVTIANHFKINITAMDKITARGTFSGDYFEDGDAKNGTKLNITNGDFYVKFQ